MGPVTAQFPSVMVDPSGDQSQKGIREGSVLEECVLTTPSSVSTCQRSWEFFPLTLLFYFSTKVGLTLNKYVLIVPWCPVDSSFFVGSGVKAGTSKTVKLLPLNVILRSWSQVAYLGNWQKCFLPSLCCDERESVLLSACYRSIFTAQRPSGKLPGPTLFKRHREHCMELVL